MIWSCEKTRDALLHGAMPSGAAVDEHVASCPGCAALLEKGGAIGHTLARASAPDGKPDGPASLDELFHAVESDLARERGLVAWMRSRPTPARIALGLALPLTMVLLHLALSRRADFFVYPIGRMLAELGLYSALAWAAARQLLRPVHLRSGQLVALGLAAAALLVPVALALGAPAHEAHAASFAGVGADFWPRAFACFRFGAMLSIPVMVVLTWADRLEGRRAAFAALAAGMGGLVGNVVLHVHCPLTGLGHLLMGHATIGFALVPVILVITWWRRQRRPASAS